MSAAILHLDNYQRIAQIAGLSPVLMKQLLVIVLALDKPRLLLTPDDMTRITFRQKDYIDLGIETFYGFYDWLRTAERVVIGVRIDLSANELRSILLDIKNLNYVSLIQNSNTIEIFFTDKKNYDPELSADQDLLDNRLYMSDDGIYALSFDPTHAIESLNQNPLLKLEQVS
jgi:hypothetical protein